MSILTHPEPDLTATYQPDLLLPAPGLDAPNPRTQIETARTWALRVTVVAAALPTLLSAQGMIGVGTDILGLHVVVAAALAIFLELALIASGLLSRVSALEGRPGGADVIATWVVSFVSGCFSAAHELIAPVYLGDPSDPTSLAGTRWQDDPASLLAAAVRLAAPLVAAWLWHRVLTRDRRTAEDRSLAEIRRTRRLLALASSARVVRRLDDQASNPRKLGRARRRMDRRHARVLRLVRVTDPTLAGDIAWALGCLADSDAFAALTRGNPAHEPAAAPGSTLFERPELPQADPAGAVSAKLTGHDTTVGSARVQDDDDPDGEGPDDGGPDNGPGRGARARSQARLAQAVKIVEANPAVTGPQMAHLMASRGHPMTDRTGLRWVEKAQREVASSRSLSVVRG